MSLIELRDDWWWYKLNGLMRHAIVRGLYGRGSNTLVLTEYPKSGGSWIAQMLAVALEIPYPRNQLPQTAAAVIHGCYQRVYRDIDTIVLWRDGRDTMVSYYYHLMFNKPNTSAKATKSIRSELAVSDPYDIKNELPRFIEWAFNGGYPRFTWSDFVRNWYGNESVLFTSYENCLRDPIGELERLLNEMEIQNITQDRIREIVEEHSFERQSQRKRGEEDVHSFIRKGIAGDWMNVFNKESREIFNHYAGAELIMLGYESDSSWTIADN